MQRITLTIAAIGAGAAVAVPLTSAGAQSPGPRTIRLVEHNKGSTFGFVDNPPRIKRGRRPVLSPGDMTVFSVPVFDAANRTRRGTLHLQCVVTRRGDEDHLAGLCTAVLRLSEGQISLATAVRGDPRLVRGIVTGGSGAYAGARGTFRSRTTRIGARDTITLTD